MRIAEDAVALLDRLGIERAALLGHDWGGWAGWHAALRFPERWVGYVATGIPHPWPSPRAMLETLPRLFYQPPIATPGLGPRLVPALVPRILRAAWGDRETYDRAPRRSTPSPTGRRPRPRAATTATGSCTRRRAARTAG